MASLTLHIDDDLNDALAYYQENDPINGTRRIKLTRSEAARRMLQVAAEGLELYRYEENRDGA